MFKVVFKAYNSILHIFDGFLFALNILLLSFELSLQEKDLFLKRLLIQVNGHVWFDNSQKGYPKRESLCFESKIRIKGLVESPGAAPTRKTCAEEKEEGIAAKSCALRCEMVMAMNDE